MSEQRLGTDVRTSDLGVFWFLVDAPMFIDEALVDRFHDALIRPDSIMVSVTDTAGRTSAAERKLGIEGQGEGEVPFVLSLAVKANFDHRFTKEATNQKVQQLAIPRTPERLLEEVIAFYLAHFPERILVIDPVKMTVRRAVHVAGEPELTPANYDTVFDKPGPRPIVLIDSPENAKVIPMAGEFKDGKVEVIYNALVAALSTPEEPLKRFSRGHMSKELRTERWNELVEKFDPIVAMNVLEDSGKDRDRARFEWIDFRMAWGDGGDPSPLHLHVCPNGEYAMGTFAHAFVRRAFSNGVRIVGTLKTGGDINVLAIYER